MPDTTPRIYVACLACYNEGRLHGVWLEDCTDADAMDEQRQAMQEQCGHTDNDWAIHDYEGFRGVKLSESESFSTVAELAAALEERGEAFAIFYNNDTFSDVSEALERFGEAFAGEADTAEDWAEEFLEESGQLAEVPEWWRQYIDVKSWLHDQQQSGELWYVRGDGSTYVYWNR